MPKKPHRIDPSLGDYATLEGFGEMLSKNRRTISRYVNDHGLPHVRIGNRVYIPLENARDWIRRRVIDVQTRDRRR